MKNVADEIELIQIVNNIDKDELYKYLKWKRKSGIGDKEKNKTDLGSIQ